MNRRKIAACAMLLCLLPLTASANSSWWWISETRPYDVLPFVALITIAIETAALWWTLGKQHLTKIAVVVVIANLLSFAAPYLDIYFGIFEVHLYPFWQTLERFPSYTVRGVYLTATLIIELPVVFFSLRKHAERKGSLLLTAACANLVTTLLTAAAERLFCYGQW